MHGEIKIKQTNKQQQQQQNRKIPEKLPFSTLDVMMSYWLRKHTRFKRLGRGERGKRTRVVGC